MAREIIDICLSILAYESATRRILSSRGGGGDVSCWLRNPTGSAGRRSVMATMLQWIRMNLYLQVVLSFQ